MKKFTLVLLGLILAMSMTACGKEKANGGDSKAANAKTETKAAESTSMTVDELIKKTTEASNGMKSYSMDMNMNENISVKQGDQQQDQKIEMKMKIDAMKDPMQMYSETNMSAPGSASQNIKMYITKEGIFANQTGTWTKLPDSQKDQLLASMDQSSNPGNQLEKLKSIAKDAKVAEEGNEYLLTADLSGDGVKDFAKSLMNQSGNSNPQAAQMLDQMNIKNLKISYNVNKDNFFLTKANVEMTMEMEAEGQKVTMEMKMDTTVSKHNEIKEIKVPEDVLKSAK